MPQREFWSGWVALAGLFMIVIGPIVRWGDVKEDLRAY